MLCSGTSGMIQTQQLARKAAHKPFVAHTLWKTHVQRCARASAASRTRQPCGSSEGEGTLTTTLSQRLLTAALAASVLLGSGSAVAIGPVSVKLEDLQISQTDCGGETCLVVCGVVWLWSVASLLRLTGSDMPVGSAEAPQFLATVEDTAIECLICISTAYPQRYASCSRPTSSRVVRNPAAPCMHNQAGC